MEKLRSEMNPVFQWDLSDIFQNREDWEHAFQEASKLVAGVPAIAGTLGESADALKTGLDKLYSAAEKAERVYVYAFLNSSGDNGNAEAQEMEARATRLFVDFSYCRLHIP